MGLHFIESRHDSLCSHVRPVHPRWFLFPPRGALMVNNHNHIYGIPAGPSLRTGSVTQDTPFYVALGANKCVRTTLLPALR